MLSATQLLVGEGCLPSQAVCTAVILFSLCIPCILVNVLTPKLATWSIWHDRAGSTWNRGGLLRKTDYKYLDMVSKACVNIRSSTTLAATDRRSIITHFLFKISRTDRANIMGQIASVQSPDMDPEVAQQLQILNESYNQARSRLDRVQDDLALLLKQGGGQLIDKLEIAMTRAYKLAILIRGPYDVESREVNKKQQQADLGSLAIATFQEVESSANALLAAVAQQSSTVMSVRNEIVMPGKERIEKLQLRINDQMMGLNEKIAQIDSIIQNLQNEVSQRNDALRNLHEKIAESQQARLASDIGVSSRIPSLIYL